MQENIGASASDWRRLCCSININMLGDPRSKFLVYVESMNLLNESCVNL